MKKLTSLSILLATLIATNWAWAQNLTTDELHLVELVNQERAAAGLDPLQADGQLAAVARSHSLDMARNRFFSHHSPNTGSMGDRLERAGVPYRRAAENIAINNSIEAAHQALMESPHHRHNVLNPEYSEIGIGVVRVGEQVLVTQAFVRPQEPPINPDPPAVPESSAATEEEAAPQVEQPLPEEPENENTEQPLRLPTPSELLGAITGATTPIAPAPQSPIEGQAAAPEASGDDSSETEMQSPGIYVVTEDGRRHRINLDAGTLLRVMSAL